MLAELMMVAVLAQAPGVIFDTDMGNDIDDALALAMLHSMESRGEIKLLAVTLTKDNLKAAQYCDLVNHFYGRGKVPIGLVNGGKTPEDAAMISVPVERKDSKGAFVYPRSIKTRGDVADSVELLTRILKSAQDQSVIVVQVGFSTNLARLLDTKDGKALAAKKVKLLSAMAGAFPGKPEYNIKIDIPAAQKVFGSWPTPVVASGYEIGIALEYPASSIEKDFSYVQWHPVADAYRAYKKMPYDRPTWDLTSVLYGVRPNGYFNVSGPGTIQVGADGTTKFNPDANGKHRYLILDSAQKQKVMAALIELSSQKPRVQ